VDWLSNRGGAVGRNAVLLKVFLPYLYWNVVFDNSRVVAEMGRAPEPFSKYCYPLLNSAAKTTSNTPFRNGPPRNRARPPAHRRGYLFETGSRTVTDLLLEAWVSGLIELTKLQWMLGGGARWKPGEPLKLLLRAITGRETPARMSAWKKCCGRCGTCWVRSGSSWP